MKFLKFDEFLSESNNDKILENLFPGALILEKQSFGPEKDPIKFAIVMATHKVADDAGSRSGREKHKPQIESFRECIESIAKQKHKEWKLFVCGDAYDGDEEIVKILKDNLDAKQYWYHNLSKSVEREKAASSDDFPMHKMGGVTPWNTCMKQIKSEPSFKYAIKIGHDDIWDPEHLELHAKAYTQFPESVVVWTKTSKKRVKGGSGLLHWPNNKVRDISYETLDFREGNTADIYSWDIDTFKSLKWRAAEQKTTAPKREKFIPGDVDMWQRMGEIIKEKELKTLYIPKATYKYRNSHGKLP